MMKKEGKYSTLLNKSILWEKNSNAFEDSYIQAILQIKLELLLSHFDITVQRADYSWPLIGIKRTNKLTKAMGLKTQNPFFDLAVALALRHVPGFRIVKKRPGRPKKDDWEMLYRLGMHIKEKSKEGKSASETISQVIKEKGSPFLGMNKATVERKWKSFKSTEYTPGQTYGKHLQIDSKRKKDNPC